MPKGTKGVSNREDNYQCIEYYIKRNPDLSIEQCEDLRRSRIRKSISTRPSNTGDKNPAHHTKTSEYERKRRSAMCLEYWEWKYPNSNHEAHVKMLEDHHNKIKSKLKDKSNQPKCVEYWIGRGYSVDEAKDIISKSQKTFTLDKCIEKYGDGRSPQSIFAKNLIYSICNSLNIEIPKREIYISNHTNHYAFDFTLGNKMIEFNGDFWHCNPSMYKADFFNKVKRMTAQEIWEYDKTKLQCAKDNNYNVLVIWESEYNANPEATLQKCIEFLNG